jgi:hypothetical protein
LILKYQKSAKKLDSDRYNINERAAITERLYLVKNQKWNQKIIIGLNKMP